MRKREITSSLASPSSPPVEDLHTNGDDPPERRTANADSGGSSVTPHKLTPTPTAKQGKELMGVMRSERDCTHLLKPNVS